LGATHEQDFLKRAISALSPEPLTTLTLHYGSHPSTVLEYINKRTPPPHSECPKLFDQTEYQTALSELKANIRKKHEEPVEN
jgi:hypothetical protein